MTLQASTSAKAASDSNKASADISATALCTVIDGRITAAASNGLYAVSLKMVGNHVDGAVMVDMDSAGQQSLADLMTTLKDSGYRASEFINCEDKVNFRVDVKIAWDNV